MNCIVQCENQCVYFDSNVFLLFLTTYLIMEHDFIGIFITASRQIIFSAILFVAYWCSKPHKTRTVSRALCIMGWEWRHPPVSLWNALFYIRVHTGLDDSCGKLICLIYLTRSLMFLRVISYQPMQNTFYWCIFRAEFIEASQDARRFLSQKHEVPESEKLSRN